MHLMNLSNLTFDDDEWHEIAMVLISQAKESRDPKVLRYAAAIFNVAGSLNHGALAFLAADEIENPTVFGEVD